MTNPAPTIPPSQDVDFLPAEFRAARDRSRKRVWRRALLGVFLGLIVAGALRQHASHVALRERTADMERRVTDAERHMPHADALRKRIDSLSDRTHLWLRLRLQPRASRLLVELAEARPERVSLSSVVVEHEVVEQERPQNRNSGSKKKDAEQGDTDPVKADLEALLALQTGRRLVVRVEGLASSDVLVSQYLGRLQSTGLFAEVRLQVTESARFRDFPMRRFALRLVVRDPQPFESDPAVGPTVARLLPTNEGTPR